MLAEHEDKEDDTEEKEKEDHKLLKHNAITSLMALLTDSSEWLTMGTQCIPSAGSMPADAVEHLLASPWTPFPQPQANAQSIVSDGTHQQANEGEVDSPSSPGATPETSTPKKPTTRRRTAKAAAEDSPKRTDSPSSFVPPSPAVAKKVATKFSTPPPVVLHGVITSALAFPNEFPVYSLEGCYAFVTGEQPPPVPIDGGFVYTKWLEQKRESNAAKSELCQEVQDSIRHKLAAMDKIIMGTHHRLTSAPLLMCPTGLRAKHKISAFKKLDGFALGQQLMYAHPMLSRLTFIHQYESLSQCLSIKKERAASRGVTSYHANLIHC